jgi:hypothetical protein
MLIGRQMHMATQLLTRKQKGEQIDPEDIVEVNPLSYFVKSQTGKPGYAVTVGASIQAKRLRS